MGQLFLFYVFFDEFLFEIPSYDEKFSVLIMIVFTMLACLSIMKCLMNRRVQIPFTLVYMGMSSLYFCLC